MTTRPKLKLAYGTPGKTDFIEDAETIVIYIDGDENTEIIVKGPNPIALAELIVDAVNRRAGE
jgi:hypothetical protein